MQSWFYSIEKRIIVSACIKDLTSDLESATHKQRAEVLALAHYLRCDVLDKAGIDKNVLDNPVAFNRSRLLKQFELLERVHDDVRQNLRSTIKNLNISGYQLQGYKLQHIQKTLCAIELWMCTIGAGFVPEKKYQIMHIWRVLKEPRDRLVQAISKFRHSSNRNANISGIPADGLFDRINADEWLIQCNFRPSAFTRTAVHAEHEKGVFHA